LELQATGRLLSYNPKTEKTKVELAGLRFANGVALGPNEDYVLVNETIGARILSRLTIISKKHFITLEFYLMFKYQT
jgi:sugar lactone lactonase YvrE